MFADGRQSTSRLHWCSCWIRMVREAHFSPSPDASIVVGWWKRRRISLISNLGLYCDSRDKIFFRDVKTFRHVGKWSHDQMITGSIEVLRLREKRSPFAGFRALLKIKRVLLVNIFRFHWIDLLSRVMLIFGLLDRKRRWFYWRIRSRLHTLFLDIYLFYFCWKEVRSFHPWNCQVIRHAVR